MTTPTLHTLYCDPVHHLTITARIGLSGEWLVLFVKHGKTSEQLYRCAVWLPSGRWDENRWHPTTTTRLGPPAALVEVERWLMHTPAE